MLILYKNTFPKKLCTYGSIKIIRCAVIQTPTVVELGLLVTYRAICKSSTSSQVKCQMRLSHQHNSHKMLSFKHLSQNAASFQVEVFYPLCYSQMFVISTISRAHQKSLTWLCLCDNVLWECDNPILCCLVVHVVLMHEGMFCDRTKEYILLE